MAKVLSILILSFSLLVTPGVSFAFERGIYITQNTLESTKRISKLIKQAKAVDIDTFVIDIQKPTKRYTKNIQLVHDAKLNYVARVVVFPHGGVASQVKSNAYWDKKFKLIRYALEQGADEIQLDYIRYKPSQRPSDQNAKDIHKVIKYYRNKIPKDIPLQIDVFGIASFSASRYIGHDLPVFANTVQVMCPMVYPSHYRPYRYHSDRPYETITKSLDLLKKQFAGDLDFRLVPWIEVRNFRYRASRPERVKYVYEQLRAVQDEGADGWYAWSPGNKYDYLFQALKQYKDKLK